MTEAQAVPQLLDLAELLIRAVDGLTRASRPDVGLTVDKAVDGIAELRDALCIVDDEPPSAEATNPQGSALARELTAAIAASATGDPALDDPEAARLAAELLGKLTGSGGRS